MTNSEITKEMLDQAAALAEKGDFEASYAQLQSMLSKDSRNARIHLLMSKCLFGMTRMQEGFNSLVDAFSLAPHDRGNILEITALAIKNEAPSLAIKILKSFLMANPDDIEVLRILSDVQFDYLEVLEKNADLSQVVNNLHTLLKTHLRGKKINVDTLEWEIMGGLAVDAAIFPKLKASGYLKEKDPIFLCGESANPPLVNLISRSVPVAMVPDLGTSHYLGYIPEKSQYFLLEDKIKEKLFSPVFKSKFDDCFNFYHSTNGRSYYPIDEVSKAVTSRVETVTFSEEETNFCKNYISEKLNIPPTAEWVCVYARDPGYYGEAKDDAKFFRNAPLNSFFPAISKIVEEGGYVVRVGSKTKIPIGFDHPRVVDYALKFQNQLVDLYLIAKSKLLFGSPSGLTHLAFTFNTQCLNVHTINFYPSWGALYIPKKPVDAASGTPLNLETYFTKTYKNPEFIQLWEDGTGQEHKLGIKYVDNSAEEILEAYEEYILRKSGKYEESEEEKLLLGKFKTLISTLPGPYTIETPSQAGFLLETNTYLNSN